MLFFFVISRVVLAIAGEEIGEIVGFYVSARCRIGPDSVIHHAQRLGQPAGLRQQAFGLLGHVALLEVSDQFSGAGVSQHGLDIRLSQADRLARSTDLDMVAVGWRPTVGNYLGRVTKPRILEAVREGAGDRAADLIGHLKKGDMAKEAERLLAETGWLPEPLRMVDDGIEVDPASGAAAEADDFADFLSGDGEDDPADEEEEQHIVAAE